MVRLETESFQNQLQTKILELSRQPEYAWDQSGATYATDKDGLPAVKVSAANCPIEYDIWGGIRNPATVGSFPIGFPEAWDYYANRRKRKTDESGRATIFQTATPFAEAVKRYKRAVLISAMLPLAKHVFETYNAPIKERGMAPWEGYCKAWSEINQLLDRGITRAAYSVMNDARAVLVMNEDTVMKMSREAIPQTRQGASHGVCKGGNYSQKSVSVLTGLTQFGVSRIAFRDELGDGNVERFIGVLRSVIVFDPDDPVSDRADEVIYIDDEWKRHLAELSDFTNTSSATNSARYCTYIPEDGETGCGKCVAFCPSNALKNSSPQPDGTYSDRVGSQSHRFWDGELQFDNGSCCDERGQLSDLYSEWMCGRCVSICGGEGVTRSHSE